MGSSIYPIGGISNALNIARPSVIHFKKTLKINKDMMDIMTYNTIGPSGAGGTGLVVANS